MEWGYNGVDFNGQSSPTVIKDTLDELEELHESIHKLKQELRMAELDIKSLAQVVSNMREEEITYEEYDDGLPRTNETIAEAKNSDIYKAKRRIAKNNRECHNFRKRDSTGSRTAFRSRSNLYLD